MRWLPASASAALTPRWELARWLPTAGWHVIVPAGILAAVNAVMPAANAIVIGRLVSDLARSRPMAWTDVSILVGLLVLSQLTSSLAGPVQAHVTTRIAGRVRQEVRVLLARPAGIEHLEDQAVRDDAHLAACGLPGGSIATAATTQLWSAVRAGGLLSAAIVAATIVPQLVVFTLAAMLLQRLILRRQVLAFLPMLRANAADDRAARYWADTAAGPGSAKEIRVFGLAEWAVDRQHEAALASQLRFFTAIDRFSRQHGVVLATSLVGFGVPFLVLAWAGATGQLAPGALATALTALSTVATIGSPSLELVAVQSGILCLRSLDRLRHLDTERRAAQRIISRAPAIAFENVTFSYPGHTTPVLRDLSLEIPWGRSVAIVGRNGAGKTTLVKLLCCLYRPTRGRILIDGVDLASIEVDLWRARLAVMFQDPVHYPLSAADNVGLSELGRPDLSRVARAGRVAGLRDAVRRLPNRWATVLSRAYEGGRDLSGGGWQSVALARALYSFDRDRDILLLDEPTGHLDPEAERTAFARVLREARGRTAVIVSHRFSTVSQVDHIVVVSDGSVAESGSHQALIEAGGLYHQFFTAQAGRFRDTGAESVQRGQAGSASPPDPAQERIPVAGGLS